MVEPLGLDPAKVHVPGDVLNGTPLEDGDKVALAGPAYDRAIEAAGGIDVQILGIGTDGHVASTSRFLVASGTRVKTLAEQTRIDNARFFDNDINQVPTHCITQGIGTIMKARHLVLLAFGAGKAEAIEETVEAACQRSARLPRCRCTRTPRLSWMRRPRPACATRTTTVTPTPTSRPGRASELSCAGSRQRERMSGKENNMSDRNEIVSRVTAALEASRLRWRFVTRARWMRAANGADIGSSPMPPASSWRPARGRGPSSTAAARWGSTRPIATRSSTPKAVF